MSNNKGDRLTRKYSHSEFLEEFFPNIKPDEIPEEKEETLTKDEFFEMLTKVTSAQPSPPDKGKSKTSG